MSYPTKLQLALSYGPKSYLAAENEWYNARIMGMALPAFGFLAFGLFSFVIMPLKFAAIPIAGFVGLGFTGSLIVMFYLAIQKHRFDTQRLTKTEYDEVLATENYKNTLRANIATVRQGLKENRSYSLVSLKDALGEYSQVIIHPMKWKETKILAPVLLAIAACVAIVIFSLNAHQLISKRLILGVLITGVIFPLVAALSVIIVTQLQNRKLERREVEYVLHLEETHLRERR